MARLILLAVIAAGIYWWLRGGRGSIDRLLPPLAIGLALLYLISPIDLIPDVGIVGFLDDVAMLVAAAVWAHRQTRSRPRGSSAEHPRQDHGEEQAANPYEILGIERGASSDEITRAYREKLKLYHPDRVNGLGEELQRVATRKTIEIKRAYDALRGNGS